MADEIRLISPLLVLRLLYDLLFHVTFSTMGNSLQNTLRIDLEITGIHIDSSTVIRRLHEGGRKAIKPAQQRRLLYCGPK